MRWALVKVCLAVTAMVVVAFAVPLGLVVKEMARDRALTAAERQASAVGPALAITTDPDELERAVGATEAGAEGRIAVYVPGNERRADDVDIGQPRASRGDVTDVSKSGRARLVPAVGGHAFLQPTAVDSGRVAVVEIFVPDGELTNGVATSWAVLAGVGLGLIIGSVAVADRLGMRMVRPAERLAGAAHELGEGKLEVRVKESGPAELRSAAAAFNSMADQVVQLLASERELAADISHRLRTPLTVLRLNAASLGDNPSAEQTRQAVAQLEREVDEIISAVREQKNVRSQHQHQHSGEEASAAPAAAVGCDISEVTKERMAFWSALAEDECREVRIAGVERGIRVPVGRSEMAAALDSMIGNVFRHTPEGTAFSVDIHDAGNAVIMLVSDAGPGIEDPAAAMERGRG
ncbi:HAMP domain-containing histidine kinase, partial [Streptomyces sp. A7024]